MSSALTPEPGARHHHRRCHRRLPAVPSCLREAARGPRTLHARPAAARSRQATLDSEPARGRCPQCRVSNPSSVPIGSLVRARATSRARTFVSFMRLALPRPPPLTLPFTHSPHPDSDLGRAREPWRPGRPRVLIGCSNTASYALEGMRART